MTGYLHDAGSSSFGGRNSDDMEAMLLHLSLVLSKDAFVDAFCEAVRGSVDRKKPPPSSQPLEASFLEVNT